MKIIDWRQKIGEAKSALHIAKPQSPHSCMTERELDQAHCFLESYIVILMVTKCPFHMTRQNAASNIDFLIYGAHNTDVTQWQQQKKPCLKPWKREDWHLLCLRWPRFRQEGKQAENLSAISSFPWGLSIGSTTHTGMCHIVYLVQRSPQYTLLWPANEILLTAFSSRHCRYIFIRFFPPSLGW